MYTKCQYIIGGQKIQTLVYKNDDYIYLLIYKWLKFVEC